MPLEVRLEPVAASRFPAENRRDLARTAARTGPAPPRGLHRFARGVHLSWVMVGTSSSVVARSVTAGARLVQGPKVPPLRGRARAAPSALSVGSVGTPALEVRARPSVWARQRAFPRACMDQACRGLVPPCLTRRPPTTTIIPPGVLSVVTDSDGSEGPLGVVLPAGRGPTRAVDKPGTRPHAVSGAQPRRVPAEWCRSAVSAMANGVAASQTRRTLRGGCDGRRWGNGAGAAR